jgi:hypothetical protein
VAVAELAADVTTNKLVIYGSLLNIEKVRRERGKRH